MPQRLIYHWKHGWIPLDHYAALQKAHYRESGARLIMARHGIAAERDAKHITPEHGKSRTLEKGLNQQAGQHQKRMAGEDPHFRMPGPQLKELAGNGDKGAQAELDRRAARKAAAGGKFGGHKQGVPFRPPTASPQAAPEKKPPAKKLPELTAAEKAANAAKMYGVGSDQHVKMLEVENREIEKTLPAGHQLSSKGLAETGKVLTTHYAGDKRLGMVVTHPNGQIEARYSGASIGLFDSRQQAHQALARAHDEALQREAKKQARAQAQARTRKVAEADTAKRAASSGPLKWQPGTVPQDGSLGSRRAAEKAKQVFEAGNKRVIIETALSKAKTQALLADITHVVEQSGVHDVPVTFRVPVGDKHFTVRRSMVGGYVLQGGRTVHISPHVANEDALGQKFGMDTSGDFMPANGLTPARQWVITHELGHVVDNHNGHTRQTGATPHGFTFTSSRDRANAMVNQHRDTLSRYGKSSAQEAYAEAYAQWVHGGPGSNPAADAFAAEYGWPTPKRFK
jgi:hypothetical protein